MVFGLYWFQPWKLWTNTTVDEAIPSVAEAAQTLRAPSEPTIRTVARVPGSPTTTSPAAPTATAPTTPTATAPTPTATPTAPTASSTPLRATPADPEPSSAPEPAPAGPTAAEPGPTSPGPDPEPEAVQLFRGELISHEHQTSGTVRVIRLADGSRVLTLENLATSDGPDIHVWLAAAPVIPGDDGWYVFDDQPRVDLGQLKGNLGNQVYPVPAGVDLDSLPSVTLWCERFAVSFGAAALS